MTADKIKEALATCGRYIHERVDTPFVTIVPLRDQDAVGHYARLSHLLFMVQAATTFVDEGKLDKAQHWLGFLQGALWWAGIQDIEVSKRSNMADGEAFSKERI